MKLNFKDFIEKLFSNIPLVKEVISAIYNQGGSALLVGGAVRDLILNLPVKDIDIEVHGVSLDDLEKILHKFGQVSLVGKVFGVLRLHSIDIDWSVPRADESGRKPKVKFDPHMSFKDAFARRDLTMNAMGIDLANYQLIDPFDGLKDLQEKILRAPDVKRFIEDPLRFYRVMQFIARFQMSPDETLNQLCMSMSVEGVSRERIEVEFEKMFLRSEFPSLGLRWLRSILRINLFPELAALISVEQDVRWHPEGDVFEHSMQTLDAAASLEYESDKEKLIVMYAALCHDIGKATTTTKVNGEIKSLRHEQEGAAIAKKLLLRITKNKELIDAVIKLIKSHMIPTQLIAPEVKQSAFKRLASKLSPEVTMTMLAKLCLADKLARNPSSFKPFYGSDKEIDQFLQRTHEAEVASQVEKPILMGRDLLSDVSPGPQMGKLLKEAYNIQIEEGLKDKEELKRRVLKNL